MPPVVVIAAIEIAAYYGAITTAAAILAEISIIVGTIQQRRAQRKARDAYNASLKDRLVTVATVDGPRSRVYGQVRCSDGILFKATRGDKSQFYTLLIALAGHEVQAIPTVYFNDQPVNLDGSGYVTTPPWNGSKRDSGGAWTSQLLTRQDGITLTAGAGSVTLPYTPAPGTQVLIVVNGQEVAPSVAGNVVTVSGAAGFSGTVPVIYQFTVTGAGATKARVRKYLGAPGQDLSTELAADFPALITPAHKFSGIALLRVDLEYDQDAYPQGVPTITALVQGAKVHDPRTGLTAWSNNPALCARDWALYAQGCGAAASDIDDASFIAAANACDVSHTFTVVDQDGNSVSSPQTLYQAGLVARTDEDPLEALDQLVAAMAGQRAFCGGVLRVRAGVYRGPVATITESWVSSVGDIELVSSQPRTELFNVVKPTIADAAQQYVAVPINEVRADAYVAADGVELPLPVTLAAVTDVAHAQHVCGVMLREARQALTLRLPCNLSAFRLEVFDCVNVTLPRFGFDNKLFEVLGWQFSQEGGVLLTLRETDASVFDPDAEFTATDPAPNTALPDPFGVRQLVLDEPASGTAQLLRQADGTVVSRVKVSWPAVQDEAVRNGGAIEVRYGLVTGAALVFQTATVPGDSTQVLLDGVQDGAFYVIQARARNRLVAGNWSAHKLHKVVGKTAAPAAVSGLALTVVPGALRGTRTPSTEPDYSHTLYRYGASFAAGTPVPGTSDERGFSWPWPALGPVTVWAADVDDSGNVGPAVSASVTVGSALLIGSDNADLAIPYGTMNADPGLLNPAAAWEWAPEITVSSGASTVSGALGGNFFWCVTPAERFAWTKQRFPVSAARTYNFSALLYAANGNDRTMFLVVDMYKADGTQLTGADTGWGGTLAGYVFAGLPAPDAFTRYGADFGAGTSFPIPASAATMRVGVWFQYSGSGGTTSIIQAAEDIRLVDVSEARAALVAANAAASAAADAIVAAADAQATADGKVTTFVQPGAPAAEGVGDLWIDSDDGNKLYRWSGSAWVQIRDTGIGQALTNANNAQATADGKIVSFYQASPPTAGAVGDLWTDTDDGNKLYRWSGGSWVSVRDAGIAQALADAAAAQATADGKVELYYQPSAPAGQDGDIWFDTDDGNKQYVRVAGSWVLAADTRIGLALTNAAGAQATADGKVTTFFAGSAPTAGAVGDLWFNTADGRVKRWSGSAWVTQSVIGAGDVGTGNLADQAATEITQDNYAFGGATPANGVVRTLSYTPPVDCRITFTAVITASNVYPDSGNYLEWQVSAGGGANVTLGTCNGTAGGRQTYSCATSFAASAGVALVFKLNLDRAGGNPAIGLWDSSMRVEAIKR